MAITVTAEDYGGNGELDVIVVRINGKEVGAYCVAEDPEAERQSMQDMVDAIVEHEEKFDVRRT